MLYILYILLYYIYIYYTYGDMRGEIYEPMGTYNYEDITKGFSIHNGNLNPVMSTLRITTHSASSLKPEPTFTRRL